MSGIYADRGGHLFQSYTRDISTNAARAVASAGGGGAGGQLPPTPKVSDRLSS